MRAREGDLLETSNQFIFHIKGLIHPPGRVVAFIRYFPDPNGNRKRNKLYFKKVHTFSERYALLKRFFPRYLMYDPVFNEHVSMVPWKDVKHYYSPISRLWGLLKADELDGLESKTLQFLRLLRKTANVSWGQIGISGSILVSLHNSASDIDPVIYGSKNCSRVYSALKTLIKENEGLVKPYSTKDLKRLFYSRSQETVASFKDFVRTEIRKKLQGKFMGSDYFIRFVKNWEEIEEKYGWVRYFPEGYAKIKARVINNSEMIFTPCSYKIDNVELLQGKNVEPIEEIVSFRGRFCEQAKIGETVVAQGKVERIEEDGSLRNYRLLLGNNVSDNMVLVY